MLFIVECIQLLCSVLELYTWSHKKNILELRNDLKFMNFWELENETA